MNEPWLRIKIQPWTENGRRGRLLIAQDRLGARRILRQNWDRLSPERLRNVGLEQATEEKDL